MKVTGNAQADMIDQRFPGDQVLKWRLFGLHAECLAGLFVPESWDWGLEMMGECWRRLIPIRGSSFICTLPLLSKFYLVTSPSATDDLLSTFFAILMSDHEQTCTTI